MKTYVTMRFELNLQGDMTAQQAATWAKEDPAGFLLSRKQLQERLPYEVIVTDDNEQYRV